MSRARRSDGPVIDIHCHRECGPAAEFMADAARAAGKVALGHGNPTTQAVNRRQLALIRPKMDFLDVRLADMDRMGVDIQAVAVSVYQYYYWADAELGAKVARIVNEELVESTSAHPGRFLPLGTVPLQDTEAAIAELRYLASELGMRGIEIGTHVEGEEISSPRLEPFWAEVEALGLVVVIHTQGATHPQRLADHNFVNIIGHAFEATLATAHLIFDGVVARHPDLKIVVVHGGGYLPAYAGRIDHGWNARDDVREGVPELPSHYLRKFYFDTMVFEPDQLEYLIGKYGADHVVLGTDYPYDMGDDDPLGLLGEVPGLDQAKVDLIAGGNAARLLGLL
ncbi:amidohydrolase [Mycolicibacterium smegmatis]|uniref:amidohydrolase family protein n=1 Tax=Mycolicibacterium smegmatis TaxID=1772 RepID=UPI0005D9F83B|nr:amidohydrolase family protein [Mycolicibacterium smegmatis]MCP2628283.1 amidohydrolase [Mycolicibacterium smegmatis]MDF1897358.1 amidohydrolase family protein [Mycolicibacterium smegmatis]MDF1904199.1 amidohydrolase family protein [Mycolicibacterium smegmatis]MDF1916924.1 amidohydrolase family protein [Mycolicibacterium smegmatis]MDF1922298.1 amidohydrolase family protein [Mycolicibacterium smegmatis]